MFDGREVKCEICGQLMASGCCQLYTADRRAELCTTCKKAVKDAIEQAKKLAQQND